MQSLGGQDMLAQARIEDVMVAAQKPIDVKFTEIESAEGKLDAKCRCNFVEIDAMLVDVRNSLMEKLREMDTVLA